jgi:hypothetical protein
VDKRHKDSDASHLLQHFKGSDWVEAAHAILCKETQSEEAFLGAKAILMLNGLV